MGDTVIFGKTVSAREKALALYIANSVALTIGGALMTLDQTEWDNWWWAKRLGWLFMLIGSVTNTIKAFYSKSN